MSHAQGYLVQAEFFHTGGGSERVSLAQFCKEMQERQAGGLPLKTVIRFTAHEDAIMKCAHNVTYFTDWEKNLREALPAKGVAQHKVFVQMQFLKYAQWRRRRLRKRLDRLVIRAFTKQVQLRRSVGIEGEQHRFRPLRDNERHELIETLRRLKGNVWVFIFASTDLFSDTERKQLCAVY